MDKILENQLSWTTEAEHQSALDPSFGPLHLKGRTVEDFAVSAEYPGAIREEFFRLNWPLQPRRDTQILNVFEIGRGIVARFYLAIDPRARRLFINHLYDDIIALYPLADLTDGTSFTFKAEKVEKLPFKVVVIGGPIDLNYYHWLFSWFSRLILLDMLAPDLYNDPTVKFMIDVRAKEEPYATFLRALNIDFGRIYWSDFNTNYEIKQMVLVSFLSQNSYYPKIIDAVSARLKSGLGCVTRSPRRRVWISRQELTSPKRRVANMHEIAPVLSNYGFEDVNLERMDLSQQIELFANAEIVCGVHGAGLANIIFCPADCKVLLVEKEFNTTIGLDRTFSTLAQACGLRHDVLLAKSQHEEGVDYTQFSNLHHADIVLEPGVLEAALDRIIAM